MQNRKDLIETPKIVQNRKDLIETPKSSRSPKSRTLRMDGIGLFSLRLGVEESMMEEGSKDVFGV